MFEFLSWLDSVIDTIRNLILTGTFHGQPQYMDTDTGEYLCPFENALNNLEEEYGMGLVGVLGEGFE